MNAGAAPVVPVYLDNNSTTPMDPAVREAMIPWLGEKFGNAASVDHVWGWDAAEAVEDARVAISELAKGLSYETVLVSSATEAINTVIRSYVGFDRPGGRKIVTCETEHEAVLAPARYLAGQLQVPLEILPVDSRGHIELERVRAAVADTTDVLVALAAANGEIGTLHSIRAIAEIVSEAQGLFLCDTTQAFGRSKLDLEALGVDFAVMSAHKLYGPKGAAALFARRGPAFEGLQPLILGGGEEAGRRGGTLNTAAIVGFGRACEIQRERLSVDVTLMEQLRDHLEEGILSLVADTWVNGDSLARLCNTSNIGFRGVDSRALIRDMYTVAAATRSACSSANGGPSHVLKAIGLSDADALACVRFSVGRFTTRQEVDYAIERVSQSVHKLRTFESGRT